jgi:hypothetical protein
VSGDRRIRSKEKLITVGADTPVNFSSVIFSLAKSAKHAKKENSLTKGICFPGLSSISRHHIFSFVLFACLAILARVLCQNLPLPDNLVRELFPYPQIFRKTRIPNQLPEYSALQIYSFSI